MHKGWKIFWVVIAVVIALCAIVIAGRIILEILDIVPSTEKPVVDYNSIVVLLLTTVTVIFSFCAIVLAILGIIGFRNLRENAGKYAEEQANSKIESAFKEGGVAIKRIDIEFRKEDGHFRPWMQERIRKEVIELLPLIADRAIISQANIPENSQEMAPNEATDEGDIV